MNTYYLLTCVLLFFAGCAPVVHTYDRNTGKWSTKHFTKWEGDPVFLGQIDENVKAEAEDTPLSYGTWQEYWIERCDAIHYYGDNPTLSEHYIEYIIEMRREAGLPDIPEIDKRQFRSVWEDWTNNVDEQLTLEAEGHSPLSMFSLRQRRMTKTWLEYWKAFEENFLNDHLDIDRVIFTNGVEYINNRRKQMGLKPLE